MTRGSDDPKSGDPVRASTRGAEALPSMIAGYRCALVTVPLATGPIGLFTVADLEGYVDRGALLRGEAEPPYWAHLWTGARTLAEYVSRFVTTTGLRVLDLGCGLGLTGLAAARGGADVSFVDRIPAALEFVAASAAVNRLPHRSLCADFRELPSDLTVDLVLAAEVAYDPPSFGELAATIARHLAPNGRALLTDGYRTDSRPLYAALVSQGLETHSIDVRVGEEGHPVAVRLSSIRRESA